MLNSRGHRREPEEKWTAYILRPVPRQLWVCLVTRPWYPEPADGSLLDPGDS